MISSSSFVALAIVSVASTLLTDCSLDGAETGCAGILSIKISCSVLGCSASCSSAFLLLGIGMSTLKFFDFSFTTAGGTSEFGTAFAAFFSASLSALVFFAPGGAIKSDASVGVYSPLASFAAETAFLNIFTRSTIVLLEKIIITTNIRSTIMIVAPVLLKSARSGPAIKILITPPPRSCLPSAKSAGIISSKRFVPVSCPLVTIWINADERRIITKHWITLP